MSDEDGNVTIKLIGELKGDKKWTKPFKLQKNKTKFVLVKQKLCDMCECTSVKLYIDGDEIADNETADDLDLDDGDVIDVRFTF